MTRARFAIAALAAGLALAATAGAAPPPMAALPPATPAAIARLERMGGVLAPQRALAVRYDGEMALEGHLARPHDTSRIHSSRRIVLMAPLRARQDWSTWTDGDTNRTVESTLLVDGRVIHRNDEHSPWVELSGRDAGEASWLVWASVPALLTAQAGLHAGRGLAGGPTSAVRSRYTWADTLGRVTLDLDVVDAPTVVEVAGVDPRRGTVARECRYYGFTHAAGHPWADSMTAISYPTGASWRMHEHRVTIEEHVNMDALGLPDSILPAAPARTDTLPVVTAVAPHVWAVELPDAGTRSLVLEFTDHLVLLETSADVPHGERLRRAIAAQLPAKPVRYVSFSHHHPDYTGGLRPFIADSAIVVCARSNTDYVNEIAHWTFVLDPDRLWAKWPGGTTPRLDTLAAGRWRHADARNEVVAIDIGEQSHHTDAYVVFWLPKAKILFQGDLGWSGTRESLRASSRAAGLLQAIDAAKIAPVTVLQSWGAPGTPGAIPLRQLRELVAARAQR